MAIVVTLGVRYPSGALAAGILSVVFPQFLSEHLAARWGEIPTVLFGLGAIGLARDPRGGVVHIRLIAGFSARQVMRLYRRRPVLPDQPGPTQALGASDAPEEQAAGTTPNPVR